MRAFRGKAEKAKNAGKAEEAREAGGRRGRKGRESITPDFQVSETHKNMKVHLLGFSVLPDDHYNLNLSSGEKVNPQRCFIYFYETWEVKKEVVDL